MWRRLEARWGQHRRRMNGQSIGLKIDPSNAHRCPTPRFGRQKIFRGIVADVNEPRGVGHLRFHEFEGARMRLVKRSIKPQSARINDLGKPRTQVQSRHFLRLRWGMSVGYEPAGQRAMGPMEKARGIREERQGWHGATIGVDERLEIFVPRGWPDVTKRRRKQRAKDAVSQMRNHAGVKTPHVGIAQTKVCACPKCCGLKSTVGKLPFGI